MEHDPRLYWRVRNLPDKIERARAKLKALENEAKAVGVRDIKHQLSVVNRAGDREIEKAQIEAASRGQPHSMGLDDA